MLTLVAEPITVIVPARFFTDAVTCRLPPLFMWVPAVTNIFAIDLIVLDVLLENPLNVIAVVVAAPAVVAVQVYLITLLLSMLSVDPAVTNVLLDMVNVSTDKRYAKLAPKLLTIPESNCGKVKLLFPTSTSAPVIVRSDEVVTTPVLHISLGISLTPTR